MIELISALFKEGDSIVIEYGSQHNKAKGTILKIVGDTIAIKKTEGGIVGIKDDDIITFDSDNQDCDNSTNTLPPKEEPKQQTVATCPSVTNLELEKIPGSKTEESYNNTTEIQDEAKNKPSRRQEILAQYKPGDVIPVEVLHKIDPALSKKKLSNNGKGQLMGKDFSALGVLVEDVHKQENLKIVPAMGEINIVFPDRNFGFIYDSNTRDKIYFSFNQVIDKQLYSKLSKHVPVIYSLSNNQEGYIATNIHRPGTIEELISLANTLLKEGNAKAAYAISEHILSEYPDNFTADNLQQNLKKSIPQSIKRYSNLYSKAKKADQEKNHELALELYKQAIEKGERVDVCIKDVASIYANLYKNTTDDNDRLKIQKQAIDFLSAHEKQLPDTLSTWQHLENIYYSIKDFDSFFRVANLLLANDVFTQNNIKQTNLINKEAAAYIQLKQLDDAEQILDEVLSLSPDNVTASKLKELIQNADTGDSEQIESFVSATEFNINSGGLSSFIIQTLENYDEYAGVKTKDIESRNFTLSTLKDVREVISKAGAARAKERATFLLTEGKLMQELEPSEEIRLRTVMARYCNAMALSHISENSPLDIVRFYYNESFALEENWDSNVRQIALYLLSHVHSYTDLINDSGKNNSLEYTLTQLLPKSTDQRTWDNILNMCLNNGTIFAQLFSRLYNNSVWRDKSLSALRQYGYSKNVIAFQSQNEFIDAWNSVRENRLNHQRRLNANIKSLGDCSNIEEAVALLPNIRQYREDWILPLDMNRINTIVNFILPALDSFVRSSGYRNKESNYNNANGQIQQFVDDITNGPTKLSYEAILPLMYKLRSLLKAAFEEVVVMSKPKISMTLLSTETVVNEDETVSLQISVFKHKDSSPIKELSVEVIEDKDVTFIRQSDTQLHYNSIDGGEYAIFKLNIKVSDEVITNRATAINILCKYKSGETLREETSQVSLKLYSPDDYTQIDNPYAPIADGGPVPVDSPMFFGREEFIANIVSAITNSQSKQIIIYGQKRCGKSSVMLHLKDKLLQTGKAFCVFFSLGDIIQNLTEASFYHKILSSIQDELECLEFDGVPVPKITFPTATEFKNEDLDNPLNTFTKYMSRFKRECRMTEGWEDKNLVVMIDEFTYLYTEIKKDNISNSIMKQWKAVTQNERAQFSVVLVGQDVVPSFKKEDYARNAFGVIEDIRLTYLQDEPARELIEKPILDEKGESRYVGNAVSKIIEYTSRNPYYIQIFCARLVDYMNRNKSIKVTEADVNEVAKSFVVGEQALEEDKFDNLIRAGETEDLQEYPEGEILAILKQIATSSRNIGYCCIDDINVLSDKTREKEIIKHLIDREVLEQKGENNYRIQVKIFQEWLLNH